MSKAQASGVDVPGDKDPTANVSISSEQSNDTPEEVSENSLQYVSETSYLGHYSGPLPPPSLFNQYDKEVQRIIVNEAVENRRHRTKLENRAQRFFFAKDIIALLMAFILAFILIVGSIDIIRLGQSIEGLLGIGGTVSLVAGAFIYRDHSKRKERKEREALLNRSGSPNN